MKLTAEFDLQSYLAERNALINQKLEELLPLSRTPYKHLVEGARYSLMSAGKRIRPLLVLATAELLEGDLSSALIPACALEMVHTYSLIHDDLPCMDNSDLRRGKPSLHKVYPEGHAVLVGDFLLTYPFELLAKAPGLEPSQKVALIDTLSERAGGEGMIAGQVMDLTFAGQPVDLETLQLMHSKKTAALLTAALEFGGILSQASRETMDLLRQVGSQIGLAFQIVDDILDVTGTEEALGKPAGHDAAQAKWTSVSILGLKEAKETAEKLYDSAIDALSSLPGDSFPLQALLSLIVHRSA